MSANRAPNDGRGKGAIGITVCDRWLGDDGFWKKPYSPENVRWADWIIQSGNRKNSTEHTGVYWHEKRQKWVAAFKPKGKRYEKHFNSFDEAVAQRVTWEKEYYECQ